MKHPFDAPSKRGPDRRLAEDGESTVRLRARQTQRTTVPSEKEVLELPSSDIESFDDEDQVQRRTTPNGRSQIPKGAVKNKIQTFESGSTRGILDMQPVATTTPTIDLNGKRQSIKNSMKRKNAKTSLAVFGQKTPLDVVATSSSGFSEPLKELVGKTKPLPLEAWSMGCALQGSQPGGEPVAWLTLHSTPRSKTVLLNVLEHPQDQRSPLRRFHLDRDFSAIKYSDPAQDWNENPTVVIQLQSTSSLKVSRPDKLFKAGMYREYGR
ncbi:hypothetical protein L226DRAFT_321352 [Lentinus tigrinus ALCF2SS1-7]|uniref:uncharacterized protein n=1 Tax=Lentinus tigrinus ALCF2SS1-7 TaxID=1328758 RepID=UPI0011662BE8|nr:hypothetical protein L226DRAFT_321352 [Lentinus tigrinus ALCF2SS1-7]